MSIVSKFPNEFRMFVYALVTAYQRHAHYTAIFLLARLSFSTYLKHKWEYIYHILHTSKSISADN